MGNALAGANQLGLLNKPTGPQAAGLPATEFNNAVPQVAAPSISSMALPKTDFNNAVPSATTQINPLSPDVMMQRMASMNQNQKAIPSIADLGAMGGQQSGGMAPMQMGKPPSLGDTMQGIEGATKMIAKL